MEADIVELLGVDPSDPLAQLAGELVASDEKLLDQLVKVRRDRGLTQADVAARMGISQGAVARVESGERNPHLSTFATLRPRRPSSGDAHGHACGASRSWGAVALVS
ncbi:helix-turn-helix transcriptional regulator [Raineyella sp. W15-4]|uniref:helix-turn-helix domain-containing protein n=1 Tax=Raineyella sp. W15-4 TaxID=3081651 RepID=UPI0029559888|nr:helix-turn-helix transcriptional regulator [Raineyella sp. W15-4]WOQ18191.1 helix-turn-helix transcriptional regulator [Raineyella sp. W15-4]